MSLPPTPEGGSSVDAAPPPPTTPTAPRIPADPAAYDAERSVAARRRGLAAPYIPGGRDPDQEAAEREDRRYLRILLIMVVVIVIAGFALGLIAALLGFDGLVGNPG